MSRLVQNSGLVIASADPVGADAGTLIDQLCAELTERYGAAPSPFSPAAEMALPRSIFLVAQLDGQPVACAALRRIDDATAEIKRMYVAPTQRRRGIGRRLLVELERHAIGFGYRAVRLETGILQPEAQRLYESLGFRRIPAYSSYVGNPTSLCYEKSIGSSPPEILSGERKWQPRLARLDDIPAMETLIPLSVHVLQAPYYSSAQMQAALGTVFGVDRQLIQDGTYYVVERDGRIVGGGGWSKRRSRYGSDQGRSEPDPELDPRCDAARIRAFFVHPQWARRGIMFACEREIISAGFRKVEIVATLAGESLYKSFDYTTVERFEIALAGGLTLPVIRLMKDL